MPTYAYTPTSYSWSRNKSEEDTRFTSTHPPSRAMQGTSRPASNLRSSSPLSPPRPFFLGDRDSSTDRGSWSSLDSPEPASDSDRELLPPEPKAQASQSSPSKIAAKAKTAASAAVPSTIQPSGRERVTSTPRRRTRSSQGHASGYEELGTPAGLAKVLPQTPDATESWSPVSLYHESRAQRPPPSAFAFPFQTYSGNPDPGTPIPGSSRRSSQESSQESFLLTHLPPAKSGMDTTQKGPVHSRSNSEIDMSIGLGRPHAPFMANNNRSSSFSNSAPGSPMSSQSQILRNSAAGGMNFHSSGAVNLNDPDAPASLPRVSSTSSFRAPFLSPASRPSSVWAPPAHINVTPQMSPSASTSAIGLTLPKSKPPLPSTRLPTKLEKDDKPWLNEKDGLGRLSWWLTLAGMLIGVAGAALLCWTGWKSVPRLQDSQLCLVMEDQFDSLDLQNNWSRDVELGGFGNGEFQMTTTSSNNLYTSNSNLYIVPTLTSNEIGYDKVINGGNYTLKGCTTNNKTACSASSSSQRSTVINPVQSGRINTKGKKNIAFGKVEVRAKLPQGDWLWPAIWMLPESQTYGQWPASGEIDIMEARGNSPSYGAQGTNYVRSSLNYGPFTSLIHTIFGWYSSKHTPFSSDFHTYSLEWTGDFMRFYTDSRLHAMLDLRLTKSKERFWERGGFPETTQNGSTKVVVQDPYSGGGYAAPFDQSFYLILDLAAGGTSGWFPDNVGDKPWYDGSGTAMRDFATTQDKWHPTWAENVDDLAFRVDYVKMWKLC